VRLDRKAAQDHLDERILKLLEGGAELYYKDFTEAFGLGSGGRPKLVRNRLRVLERAGKVVSREAMPHGEETNGQPRRYFRRST
jgi:DNA-binding transcriptional ArsR family regulator